LDKFVSNKKHSFVVHTFYTQYPDGSITINKAHLDDLTWSFLQVGIEISNIRTAEDFKDANEKIRHLLYDRIERIERIERINEKMTQHSLNAIDCLLKGDHKSRIRADKIIKQLSEIQKDMIINFDK